MALNFEKNMRRREFIAALGRVRRWASRRLAFIVSVTWVLRPLPTSATRVQALLAGLGDLGYVENKNLSNFDGEMAISSGNLRQN